MMLTKNSDATTHVSEMEAHFHLIQERVDELATIGDPVGARTHFQITLKSTPESYHATVQTIDTADTLNGGKTTADEIITIFLHEAHHRVILIVETKAGEALAAYANENLKSKSSRKGKRHGPNVTTVKGSATNPLIAIVPEVEKRVRVQNKRIRSIKRVESTKK